jgi:hypothetical protein
MYFKHHFWQYFESNDGGQTDLKEYPDRIINPVYVT